MTPAGFVPASALFKVRCRRFLFLPSFRRKPESIFYRHSSDVPVIPAMYPSFRRCTRHSGESRNLAPPPYPTLPRSNGPPAKPPEKSAIFSDATHLQSVHQCGILLTASPATRPQGETSPQSQPAPPKYTATATHRTASQVQRQRHRENNRAITKQPGSGQHGQNRRYCNHRRIRHALRLIHRGCVRPRRGRSHRSMPVQQWAGAWKTRTRNLQAK